METNSRFLRWFHELERELWRFYAHFGDLCGRCARQTLRQACSGKRDARDQWCCCMIDNQVHDNWESLNALQLRTDRGWYEKLCPLEIGRMPGNGPCPALGPNGCKLAKWRPITCTTQLCSRMLRVLKQLELFEGSVSSALQIEDILTLPNILPGLYGTARKRSQGVSVDEVNLYRQSIRVFRERFAARGNVAIQAAIDAEIPLELED